MTVETFDSAVPLPHEAANTRVRSSDPERKGCPLSFGAVFTHVAAKCLRIRSTTF